MLLKGMGVIDEKLIKVYIYICDCVLHDPLACHIQDRCIAVLFTELPLNIIILSYNRPIWVWPYCPSSSVEQL